MSNEKTWTAKMDRLYNIITWLWLFISIAVVVAGIVEGALTVLLIGIALVLSWIGDRL